MGLFDPVWRTKDKSKYIKALEAVRKISDQEKLFEIALSAPLEIVQCAAVAQMQDRELMKGVIILSAFPDEGEMYKIWFFIVQHEKTRLAAIDRLDDQNMLKDLLLSWPGAFLSPASLEKAMEKITDQNILYEIATAPKIELSRKRLHDVGNSERRIRRAALEHMIDLELIKQIAKGDSELSRSAVDMFTDPKDLADIAVNSARGGKDAFYKIKDIDILFDLLDKMPSDWLSGLFVHIDDLCNNKAYPRKPENEKVVLSQDQHERMLRAYIRDSSETGYFNLDLFTSYEDLERLCVDARRKSIRDKVFDKLWKDPDYPHYRLLQIVIRSKPSGKLSSTLYDKWPKDILEQFYSREDLEEIMLHAEWPALRREAAVKILKERNLPLELLYDIYCDPESERSEIRDILKKYFENNDFNRDDLVHMAGDPEVLFPFRILCLKALFSERYNAKGGIEKQRDTAAENFLADIPSGDLSYEEWKQASERLSLFVRIVPEKRCPSYGITFTAYEASDEDEFGRYTYTQQVIHYKDLSINQDYTVHP